MNRIKNICISNKRVFSQKNRAECLAFVMLVLFLNCTAIFAQKVNYNKQDKKVADKAFDYGDYLTAIKLYDKLYPSDSNSSELNYKLGICNYELRKFRPLSKKYFDKVIAASYPEVNYYLGRLNHSLEAFDKATYYYLQYKYFAGDNEHSGKEIDDLIEKSNVAKTMISNPDLRIEINNLGNVVNSEYPEYSPLIAAEENFLLFTSRRKNPVFQKTDPFGDYFEDIYVSYKKDDDWQAPVMLDTNINTAVHDACTGLSADGEKLLIYRTSKDLRSGDIYESFKINNKWSDPKILDENINRPGFLQASACYSPGGEMIFFSSDMPGGMGGKDLYYVKKLPDGNWGKPVNLGPSINTEYNEDAPFINPSCNAIYFSSEGHKNMGGYDVFKSNFDDTYSFGPAENLGYPINTVNDDIFFVLNTNASKGYFSSERKGGLGSQDIYEVTFLENVKNLKATSANVYDETDNLIKKAELILTDLKTKKVYGTFKTNELTGKVLIISEPGKQYQITINAEGYEPLITNSFLKDNIISYTLKKNP
jgi:tetratricopeptide (TPR) repeat protein